MSYLDLALRDLPAVFLSYDEPLADHSYNKFVRHEMGELIRVHGVRGFDAAHKAASTAALNRMPDSPWFVTIDGDNEPCNYRAWYTSLRDILQAANLDPNLPGVVSFRSINLVNGACYGNGGVKVWSHSFIDTMVTHEASLGKPVIDFCWDPRYVQMLPILSLTNPAGSRTQALRAGYREGVKLSAGGSGPNSSVGMAHRGLGQFGKTALTYWTTVGADTRHGICCILGALLGVTDAYDSPDAARLLVVGHTRTETRLTEAMLEHLEDLPSQDIEDPRVTDEDLYNLCKVLSASLVKEGVLQTTLFTEKKSRVVRSMLTAYQADLERLPMGKLL